MEAKPIIREKKIQEYTEDICPHCNKQIGEKALYLIDQDDSIPWEKKRWQHRSCGGEILMPVAENPFPIEQLNPQFFSTAKRVIATKKSLRLAKYKQVETDKQVPWGENSTAIPLATLVDESGGRAQIIEDDHCYVLLLKQNDTDTYNDVSWWFPEAVEVMRKLPDIKRAKVVRYLRFADKLDSKGLFKQANRIAEVFEISDRYTALGIPHPEPDTMCHGHCEGTGFVPVKKDHKDPVFRKLWEEAEALEPTDDGYHFVECPECNGSGKRRLNAEVSYEKYLYYTPEEGGEYYVLHIPKDATPPSEGQKLILRGNPVVVQSVSTPDDIAKGRGGPVARSLEANGIGWSVNCLPEGHKWLKRYCDACDSLSEHEGKKCLNCGVVASR